MTTKEVHLQNEQQEREATRRHGPTGGRREARGRHGAFSICMCTSRSCTYVYLPMHTYLLEDVE